MIYLENTRLCAGVFLLFVLLSACSTPPQTKQLQTRPFTDLPDRVELRETPFFPQKRYQCGPAALATVLAAHKLKVTPEELVDAVFIPSLNGSLPEEISATARRYGMLAYPLRPSLTDLLREVAEGNPVLVFQNLGNRWFPKWHFAVAVGYDITDQDMILRSGTRKRWLTTFATFERTWSRSDYWALVILPAGVVPATAESIRYLEAAYDLETSGEANAAVTAYRSATQRWSDNSDTWMALGNSLYAIADFAQSEAAFREAIQKNNENTKAWNNLAYVLVKNDCPQQARLAASCAIKLAPNEFNYLDTGEEIGGLSLGDDAPHCVPVVCPPGYAPL